LAPLLASMLSRRAQVDLKRLAFMHPREQMRFVAAPGRLEVVLNAGVQFFDRGFGQSLRFPLLDLRIIAFMQSVPADELQHDGETRSLFRRAMKGIVPESVRLRQDKGPAFDPLLAARVAAAREDLQDWAARTTSAPWWNSVDRARFLRELAAIRPAARNGWRPGMFQDVLTAGRLARFVEWTAQNGRHAT
jgi:asparagine synthase (glutamine-hydrolysing)